jgi:hypothetical protein
MLVLATSCDLEREVPKITWPVGGRRSLLRTFGVMSAWSVSPEPHHGTVIDVPDVLCLVCEVLTVTGALFGAMLKGSEVQGLMLGS